MFGRELWTPVESMLPNSLGLDYLHQLQEHIRITHKLARDHQGAVMARQKRTCDVHCWGQAFQPRGPCLDILPH